jgi:hypothetical protein
MVIQPESGTWRLGNKERPELKHLCIVSPSTCRFFRFALTVLGTPNGRPERACGFAAGAVSTLWLKIVVSMPPFEEAVLNWIVSTCKPFTCVERLSFRAMVRSAGFSRDSAIEDAEDIKIRSSLSRASSRRHNRRDTVSALVLNWIVSTCKPFTCVERLSFRAMVRSAGFQDSIPVRRM